jgi:putative PLP-dependent aminotransferase (TIGR04422 family)
MQDIQWPTATTVPVKFQTRPASNQEIQSRIKLLEDWFIKFTGCDVVLFSSGRSAISTILSYYHFNRSHVIFGPKWSSFCLWETICRVSNPTITFENSPDAAVIVHKWGKIETIGQDFAGVVIEDSVDNIIDVNTAHFPNGGKFEVISFPKIMGARCGGAVLTRDKLVASKLRELRRDNTADVIQSAQLKLNPTSQGVVWQDWEHKVNGLDINMLNEVESTLDHLSINKKIISERISSLKETILGRFIAPEKMRRSPSVIPIPTKFLTSIPENMLIRNINTSSFSNHSNFEPAILLPIHFGMSERDFKSNLNALLKPGIILEETP